MLNLNGVYSIFLLDILAAVHFIGIDTPLELFQSINQSINQLNEHLIPHVGGRPGYKLQTEL